MRRIVITGSESTGKTTLASRLAERYGTVASPEFAREYLDRRGAPLDRHDVEAIAVGQMALEDRYRRRSSRILFSDTDLFSTVVYGGHYYGAIDPWIARAAVERRGDLYLLLDIDVPWVGDAQRDREDRRREMHALFIETIGRFDLKHVTIGGSWAERWERALRAVDSSLG